MKVLKALSLGLAMCMAFTFAPSILMAEKPIVLRCAQYLPDIEENNGEHFLAKEVYKRTNGRVKIEIYFGGTLGKAQEMLDLVKMQGKIAEVDLLKMVARRLPGPVRGEQEFNGAIRLLKMTDEIEMKFENKKTYLMPKKKGGDKK